MRHLETQWSKESRLQGWHDPPLDFEGIRCLLPLGVTVQRSINQRIKAIATSPLRRAVMTAEHIADTLAVEGLTYSKALIEINLGEWEGMKIEEVEMSSEEQAAWDILDPCWPWGKTGETISARASTAGHFLRMWMRSNPGESPLLVVSHGLLLQGLFAKYWLGDKWRVNDIVLPLGSVVIMDVSENDGRMELVGALTLNGDPLSIVEPD